MIHDDFLTNWEWTAYVYSTILRGSKPLHFINHHILNKQTVYILGERWSVLVNASLVMTIGLR